MTIRLGNTPEGVQFLERIETSAFRKALVGDNMNLNANVYNPVGEVERGLASGLKTIKALSVDETKTPVAREEAKKRIADQVVSLIEYGHTALVNGAARLDAEAAEIVKKEFAPKPEHTVLDAESRQWIRDTYSKPGGIVAIREAVTTNSDFATVVHNAPHQLLGMPVETMSDMQMAGLKAFAPDAWARMEDSKAILKVAKNYPELARSVESSFYNPALAIRAASRVDV